jgi:nitrite reductase/ring-hydroxylating ferredoxin subunit
VHVGDEPVGEIVLRDTAERLGDLDLPIRVLKGDPGDGIARLADAEGHDLVVVGNKGMSGGLRFLAGVVPDKVSHQATCDVLIVNTVGRTPEDLEPGEGAIVEVGGKKVAAYRDDRGELVLLSPKCKHLGCTVGWNHRAKTWDCPCHGSRYESDGAVKNGPTRHPLDPFETATLLEVRRYRSKSGSVKVGPPSPPYATPAKNTSEAPSSARSFWNCVMSWSRAIASSFGIVQKLWMKNVVPNRNTAIASADRSAQIPAMTPIPPRMIITPLTRTAGPANGIFLAAA